MKLLCLIMVFLLASCQDFVVDKTVIGRYHLIAVDEKEDLHLGYQLEDGNYIGIIHSVVYAAGHNDKYIIVKQHPEANKIIVNYYIVPIYPKNQYWIEKEIFGPFNASQFEQKKKDLNMSNVEFTIVYNNLQ